MTVLVIVIIVSLDVALAVRERQLLRRIQENEYPILLISRDL